jgi:hypothetical protein
MTAEDVGGKAPAAPTKVAAAPTRGIGKQISQAEYDARAKAGKAKLDAAWLASKQGKKK